MRRITFKQRALSGAMAVLTAASTIWGSMGTTAFASAAELWDNTDTEDASLFDNSGDVDVEDQGDGSVDEDLFNSEEDVDINGDDHLIEDPVLTSEDNGMEVVVTASEDVLGSADDVVITDMGSESVKEWQTTFDSMNDGTDYEVLAVYDVALVDRRGSETEPDGTVEVTFSGEKVALGIADRDDLRVYHMPDEGASEPEELPTYTDGAMSATVHTEGFSQFALVLAGNDTQKEIAFGDNEYLELDKYLVQTGTYDSETKTGGINGQNTYDIMLEQAYYDPNPGVRLPNAPYKSDFFMILDHSASMSDSPIVNTNVATENFIKKVLEVNQKRIAKAARGEYYDINPASVAYLDDEGNYILRDNDTIREAMGEHLQYITGAVAFNNHVKYMVTPDNRVAPITEDEQKRLIDLDVWRSDAVRQYKGKVGTSWDKSRPDYTSKPEDYGSGLLMGYPDGEAASTYCYCTCPKCMSARKYTTNCDASLVWTGKRDNAGKKIYMCSVHGLPSKADCDRYAAHWGESAGRFDGCMSGYPEDGNCVVLVDKYKGRCDDDCPYCYNKTCENCTKVERCLQGMTRTDMATGAIYQWIFGVRNGTVTDPNASNYTTRLYNNLTGRYDGDLVYTPRVLLITDGCPAGYSPDKGNGVFKTDGFHVNKHYDYYGASGRGENGSGQYYDEDLDTDPGDQYSGIVDSSENMLIHTANNALKYINKIKALDPEHVMAYVCWIYDNSSRDKAVADNLKKEASARDAAFKAGTGNGKRYLSFTEFYNTAKNTKGGWSASPLFMYLWSSCLQGNSSFGSIAAPGGFYDVAKKVPISFYDDGQFMAMDKGYDPMLFKSYSNASEIPDYENWAVLDDIAASKNSDNIGYAGSDSYILDEITDPFEITSESGIRVYEVPRIPTNLDENGVPRNMKGYRQTFETNALGETVARYTEATDAQVGDDDIVWEVPEEDFKWGEKGSLPADGSSDNMYGDWKDITSDVLITVENGQVQVSGYNYEGNSVQRFDKDQFKHWDQVPSDAPSSWDWAVDSTSNGVVYKRGDYGYKLVVQIPINARQTFGGNNIKTNNTDISGFYPGEPTRHYEDGSDWPKWEDNADLNPGGSSYMELYPECKVDLNVTYNIPSDSAVIYAPQTKKLHDLVTTRGVENSMWYADAGYWDLKTQVDNKRAALDSADKDLRDFEGDAEAGGPDILELQSKYQQAYNEWLEASKKLNGIMLYKPDGINNAFVNIEYELLDPDGKKVGQMSIPHGKAAYRNADGKWNVDWTFVGGPDAEIQKSGEYHISCTISPCDTERSSTWHVYTEEQGEQPGAESSLAKSPTGSTQAGSQVAQTINKAVTAKIFQLHVVMGDTKQEKDFPADFRNYLDSVTYFKTIGSDENNKHVISYKWVDIDGKYESNHDDEPEYNHLKAICGGSGEDSMGTRFRMVVPPKALDDKLVENSDGVWVIRAEDGKYVPVSMVLSRECGDIYKGGNSIDLKTMYMTDSDDKYGKDRDSVVFEHACGVVDKCDEVVFKDAKTKYNAPEGHSNKINDMIDLTQPGPVRFLVHIQANPDIKPGKTTDTPTIVKGQEIDWTVDLTNDDLKTNPNKRGSVFSMFDILPWNQDERNSQITEHGSTTKTDLKYTSVEVDYSKSSAAKTYVAAGSGKMYYTEDVNVRNAASGQIREIAWVEAAATSLGNDKYSYAVPDTAYAIKLDTTIEWSGTVLVKLKANVKDPTKQEVGDNYVNVAMTLPEGKNWSLSNPVETKVTNLAISGTVWVDDDVNGLMTSAEPRVENVKVSLYQRYDPNNPHSNPLDEKYKRVINGITLVPAYDNRGEDTHMIVPITTGVDGTYLFDDVQPGTYYVVVDGIQEQYKITKRKAGQDTSDLHDRMIDSEAQEQFVDGTASDADTNKLHSAWITEINTSVDPHNQNVGLTKIRGSISVGKTLDEIYYPSDMTDEQKLTYKVPFVFVLTNKATREVRTKEVFLDYSNYMGSDNGTPLVRTNDTYIEQFNDLDLGVYDLYEIHDAQYEMDSIECNSKNVTFDRDTKHVTITVTADENEFSINVHNKLKATPPGGDKNGVRNLVCSAVPIKLDVIYCGDDPISSKTESEYTFQASDFDPKNGGDMIVTYDDGSTRSISAGTLNFNDVTLVPATVYNSMNTPKGTKIGITAYYSERGHLLTDTFKVGVDLAPVLRFNFNFNANSGSFQTDGAVENRVYFTYDSQQHKVFVSSGLYKDVNTNPGMNKPSGFWFSGWNEAPNGDGKYIGTKSTNGFNTTDVLSFLSGMAGEENGASWLAQHSGGTLYAMWMTNVTFDANGGAFSDGSTTQVIPTIKGNSVKNPGVIPVRPGWHYVMWNTRSDGSGQTPDEYMASHGGVQGPVTFYAIYYQSDYAFTGSVQTFTAPVSGWYEVELWGSPGGSFNPRYKMGALAQYKTDSSGYLVDGAGTRLKDTYNRDIKIGIWNEDEREYEGGTVEFGYSIDPAKVAPLVYKSNGQPVYGLNSSGAAAAFAVSTKNEAAQTGKLIRLQLIKGACYSKQPVNKANAYVTDSSGYLLDKNGNRIKVVSGTKATGFKESTEYLKLGTLGDFRQDGTLKMKGYGLNVKYSDDGTSLVLSKTIGDFAEGTKIGSVKTWNANKDGQAAVALVTDTTHFTGGKLYFSVNWQKLSATDYDDMYDRYTNKDYNKGRGGEGAYTRATIWFQKGRNVHVYVGGNGGMMGSKVEYADDEEPDGGETGGDGEEIEEGTVNNDGAIAGWNGGGASLTCSAGHHSVSGGGATHISFTENRIVGPSFVRLEKGTDYSGDATAADAVVAQRYSGKEWYRVHSTGGNGAETESQNARTWYMIDNGEWDPSGTIMLAGGGGGGQTAKYNNVNGHAFGYAGTWSSPSGSYNSATNIKNSDFKAPVADNSTNTGFRMGIGEPCVNSSGAGGGWYGGYSALEVLGYWTNKSKAAPNDAAWNNKNTYGNWDALPYKTDDTKRIRAIQWNGGGCGAGGSGGTSYIDEDGSISGINPDAIINADVRGGNFDPIVMKPNTDPNNYWYNLERAGVGGYARFNKIYETEDVNDQPTS